jgi:hypothetical protein
MTLILVGATIAVLVFLGLSCRRARLDLDEQICDCLGATVPAAVGYGPVPVEVAADPDPAARRARRHLHLVKAG